MTTWVTSLTERWRRLGPPVGACASLSLAAGAARLSASDDALAAWNLALRAGAGAWVFWALATILAECLAPERSQRCRGASPASDPRTAWRVLGGAGILLAVALARTPARLAVNLIGFALVGASLLWLVGRRAGPGAATRAAIAFALLALFPTHVDLARPPERTVAAPGSAFRWTTGWPTDDWRLRYDVTLTAPLNTDVIQLWVQHAPGAAQSSGVISVSVNGTVVGDLAPRGQDWFALDLPTDAVAGQTQLRFEFWQSIPDRRQRLVAHRWSGGASLGHASSSYFDGRTWHSGTFDDVAGAARPGAYVMELQGRLWR